MKFSEVVEQASELLQRRGRLTYRTLKREFDLDDAALDDLKFELIEGQELAVDKEGKMLVWTGGDTAGLAPSPAKGAVSPAASEQAPPPATYTPSHLADRIRAEHEAMAARGAADGERKTITALFADLKGSTALIEGLDPEEARAIIDPALRLMMDAVHRYEGYVAQALGDGIFALFGAPLAHEDHPQRALYAALRMQEEMRRYGDQIRLKHGVPLAMRVGINTGEVIVRSIRKDDLHADYVPVGHSTNLAARMEQMATPGSILITEYTRKLVEGYFALKALGAAEIKGVEEPLAVYEVLGAGPLRTRLQVSAQRGLTRFVGRQSELEQLRRAWEQAKAGHGQIVGVMGEPGLGKSRLFFEFKLLALSGCLVLEAYSVSHGKASAYLPVMELLKSYFDIQVGDDERKRREKVAGKVVMLDRSLEEALPYLFALLGIEEQPSPLQQMDAQIRRRRTFEALKRLFLRESLNQPLVLIFEDLHWIDGETQGLLDTLSEGVASAKVLLLVNYRPEYHHEWGQKTYYTQLRLAPLGREEAEELLTALLGTDPSLTRLKHLILEKTEGTPFFMEEVVQTLVEEGVLLRDARGGTGFTPAPTMTSAPVLHMPTTVQGVLAARIDRLANEEKALLQQLAVIGRVFPLGLLKQVVSQPEDELYRVLAALQHKEFLYEQPAFPEVEYRFKHALTQEVAYGTVLQERRKALHERTAQAIEALYGTSLDEHYSDLAHHYSRSGNTQKAIEYLHLAGQQAAQRSANAEAIAYLAAASDLLKALPDTPARIQHELTLQLALGVPLSATKGASAPEVGRVYARARELCQQVGDLSQLFPALFGLRTFALLRGEVPTAHHLGEQLLDLARRQDNPALLLEAHRALAGTFYSLGEFAAVRAHGEQAVALYDPQQHRSHAFLYGPADSRVFCLTCVAWASWFLGYPSQAETRIHDALLLAQELAHPFSVAWVLSFSTIIHQLRREWVAALERAEAAMTLTREQGFAQFLATGMILRGRAAAAQGKGEEGIAQMRQGLTAYRATGAELERPYHLALLAEAYGEAGQREEGLNVLDEALAWVDKTGERMYEAELYRLKGRLTLQSKVQGPKSKVEEEAEEHFLKAIETARQQQAKSLELRASTSLARLWQQRKREEAHEMLAAIYNWFTEGFDTKDLQEAKALLDELAEGA